MSSDPIKTCALGGVFCMMRILPHLGDLFWMWPQKTVQAMDGVMFPMCVVYAQFFLYSYVPVSKYRMYRYTDIPLNSPLG